MCLLKNCIKTIEGVHVSGMGLEVNSSSVSWAFIYKENWMGNKTGLIISDWFQALLQFLYSLFVLAVW